MTRRFAVYAASVLCGILCLLMLVAGAPVSYAADSTLQPTETSVSIATSTPLPAFTPAALPKVDWSDVSLNKKDMKPGHENEVDNFIDANRYVIVAQLSFEEDAIIRGAERVRYTNHTSKPLNEIVF